MSTRTFDHPSRLVKNELLVPKDTPAGPPDARVSWARSQDTLITVLQVERDGKDVLYQRRFGTTRVASADELAEMGYERAGGEPI